MGANDHRVPYYYQSNYHHWDFAVKLQLGYLEGCTTKYVTRWRKKNGVADLHKARHYLDKLIESGILRYTRIISTDKEVERFAEANHLDPLEKEYIFILCTYHNEKALRAAHQILTRIITRATEAEKEGVKKLADEVNRPGTPEDGGHYGNIEEDNS